MKVKELIEQLNNLNCPESDVSYQLEPHAASIEGVQGVLWFDGGDTGIVVLWGDNVHAHNQAGASASLRAAQTMEAELMARIKETADHTGHDEGCECIRCCFYL